MFCSHMFLCLWIDSNLIIGIPDVLYLSISLGDQRSSEIKLWMELIHLQTHNFHLLYSFVQRCYIKDISLEMSINYDKFSAKWVKERWERKLNIVKFASLFVNRALPQQKVFAIPDHEWPQDAPNQPESLTFINCKIKSPMEGNTWILRKLSRMLLACIHP